MASQHANAAVESAQECQEFICTDSLDSLELSIRIRAFESKHFVFTT